MQTQETLKGSDGKWQRQLSDILKTNKVVALFPITTVKIGKQEEVVEVFVLYESFKNN